ncbi:MAG: DUF1573 domain-containing protein [Firmicutes bacterium ZCTH02-B6]|nr:MAG: DUF1573 domain-containing protein [Firmicutes bacterium ZCTH02-B6]
MAAEFQAAVSQYLIRHRSILDILAKLQETSARVQRAVSRAVTECGCLEVHAQRQQIPQGISYWEMRAHVSTHLSGSLCEQCREVLEMELGHNLFYLTALCEALNLQSDDILRQEMKRVTTLGVFNLT